MVSAPDRDFAAMMIPHHAGAIAMARAEIQYGKDPVLKRLAQEIVVTQAAAIEVMRRQAESLARSGAGRTRHRRRHRPEGWDAPWRWRPRRELPRDPSGTACIRPTKPRIRSRSSTHPA